jgi:hypothetical protein
MQTTIPNQFLSKLNKIEAFNKFSELEHQILKGQDIDFKEYFCLYDKVFGEQKQPQIKNVIPHPITKRKNKLRELKVQRLEATFKRIVEMDRKDMDFDILANIDHELMVLDIKIDHLNRKWGIK